MARYRCAYCGKWFNQMPCKVRGVKPFCSQSCRSLYHGRIGKSNKNRVQNRSMLDKINGLARLRKVLVDKEIKNK